MTVIHAHKRGTKNKTRCEQWIGKLPRGEYTTSDTSRVTCPGCM